MTNQELFDKVATRLIQQGGPAYEPGFGCKYRTDRGRVCAAGALILDEHYDPVFEGKSTPELGDFLQVPEKVLEKALLNSGVLPEQFDLVRRLQGAHDRYTGDSMPDEEWLTRWRGAMRRIGRDEGLNVSVLR
jgi:hypothetical protein